MGVSITEFYGQTHCNLVVGCYADVMEIRSGSMGWAFPGGDAVKFPWVFPLQEYRTDPNFLFQVGGYLFANADAAEIGSFTT